MSNNISNDSDNVFIICECKSPEHLLRFCYEKDMHNDNDSVLYAYMHLNIGAPFLERLKKAFFYLFKRKECCFDEVVIDQLSQQKLMNILSRITNSEIKKDINNER